MGAIEVQRWDNALLGIHVWKRVLRVSAARLRIVGRERGCGGDGPVVFLLQSTWSSEVYKGRLQSKELRRNS